MAQHRIRKPAFSPDAQTEHIVRETINIEAWYQAEMAAKQRDAMIEKVLYGKRRRDRPTPH